MELTGAVSTAGKGAGVRYQGGHLSFSESAENKQGTQSLFLSAVH